MCNCLPGELVGESDRRALMREQQDADRLQDVSLKSQGVNQQEPRQRIIF